MGSSEMPVEMAREKGYYSVGGGGGNIEWHTEADTLEIADRDNLLRDMRVYAAAVFRAPGAAYGGSGPSAMAIWSPPRDCDGGATAQF